MRNIVLYCVVVLAACSGQRENQPRLSVTGLDGTVYYEPELSEKEKQNPREWLARR